MQYLALIFDTPVPAPSTGLCAHARPAVSAYRRQGDPLLLRLGQPVLGELRHDRARSQGLSGLLWIEARDLNDALRLARDCGLERNALLELHSLELLSSCSGHLAEASSKLPEEH